MPDLPRQVAGNAEEILRLGVEHLDAAWVANLRARSVTAYAEPSGSEYASVRTYRVGESISPRAFPDVILAVSDFMPPVDE